MRGLGTIINVVCILVGGVIGCLAGNRMRDNIKETLMTMSGIGVVVIGISGVLSQMFEITDGRITTYGTNMMIISLGIGAIIGEMLQLEEKVTLFGEWLKQKSGNGSDSAFVNGFVTASCTVCIGAMAVMGAIQDGISGDYSVLLAKGILDAIIICIMASSMGKGCVFSAIPVGLLQGSVTLIAIAVGDFFTEPALRNLSLTGSVLILCVGLNLIRDKKIRVVNTLPAIIIAAAWGFLFP